MAARHDVVDLMLRATLGAGDDPYGDDLQVDGRPATEEERSAIRDAGPEERGQVARHRELVVELASGQGSDADAIARLQDILDPYWPEGGNLVDAMLAAPERVQRDALSALDTSGLGPALELRIDMEDRKVEMFTEQLRSDVVGRLGHLPDTDEFTDELTPAELERFSKMLMTQRAFRALAHEVNAGRMVYRPSNDRFYPPD